MAKHGLGVRYERGHDGSQIRNAIDAERREWYLDRWYRPHHARLAQAADLALSRAPRMLIIDAHSYPDEPMQVDADQSRPHPDACIGTADPHTPAWLVETARGWCEAKGWSLGIDAPYAGTIVPLKYFGREPRVLSVMIDINRPRYMHLDGLRAIRSAHFGETRSFAQGLVARLQVAAAHEQHEALAPLTPPR